MSYAGHVFDMIRRNKENRDMLKLRRERVKDARKKFIGKKSSYHNPNITVEELDRINRQLKEREEEQERYFSRTTLIILGIGVVIALLIFGIFSI